MPALRPPYSLQTGAKAGGGFQMFVRPPSSDSIAAIRKITLRQFCAATAAAARDTAKAAKERIRQQMRARKLGRAAGIVASTSDLEKKRVPAVPESGRGWRAGAVVYGRTGGSERAEGLLRAYSSGTVTILPRRGRWLAIATPELAKRVPGLKGKGRTGSYRMTPALYRARGLERRIGKLQLVPGKSPGEALLIVRNVQVNAARGFGGARRIAKTGKIYAGKAKRDFIVAFVLIRVTRRAQRFDPKAIFRAEFKEMPRRILRRLSGVKVRAMGRIVASWNTSFTR